MDPWELFSELCRIVVQEQNCFLEVNIIGHDILMHLEPLEDLEDEEDD